MKKITFIVAILMCSAVTAQEFTHEFSIHLGGGISSFQTRPTQGDNLMKLAGTTGIGYYYFFNPQWGIGAGLNFAVYKGGININKYEDTQKAINPATSHTFDFMVSTSVFKEIQQTTMITIPMMAQYQTDGETAFFAAFGFKAGIPFSAKTRTKGVYTTKGYYQILNVTYEDLPEYGFVTDQPFPTNKTELGLKSPAFMLAGELGFKWRLKKKISLYTGVYLDYGLNNILVKEKTNAASDNLVVYQENKPAQFAYNTAVNSYARRVAPLATGITLRLSFGCSKDEARPVSSEPTKILPPEEPKAQPQEEPEVLTADEPKEQQPEEPEVLTADEPKVFPPDEPKAVKEQEKAPQTGIDMGPINLFGCGKSDLNDRRIEELEKRIALMKQNPDLDAFIYGHTCDLGTREANEKVGLARAKNAKAYMISQGISEKRILGIATKRDTEPVVPNTDEENRKINRRVEVELK
jgi:outer membrane protein OmpA-like peptidoglycan-associated protein